MVDWVHSEAGLVGSVGGSPETNATENLIGQSSLLTRRHDQRNTFSYNLSSVNLR